MSMTSSRRLLALSFLALALSLGAMIKSVAAQDALPPVEPLREATITITGTADVTAEPDIAVVSAGAVTEATTARAALDANSKIMNDAFATLRALGIADRDMQTSNLSVSPRYTWFETQDGERRPPRIDGYTVSNTLTVRVRDLATIGEVLDALIDAGVNQMGGLAFAIDDPRALLQDARRQAVADARAQADLLAEAAGVSLGRIVGIAQDSFRPVEPPMMRMAAESMAADAVPIATGEQRLTASVTITWALEQAR